jgi:hypothetical protein
MVCLTSVSSLYARQLPLPLKQANWTAGIVPFTFPRVKRIPTDIGSTTRTESEAVTDPTRGRLQLQRLMLIFHICLFR